MKTSYHHHHPFLLLVLLLSFSPAPNARRRSNGAYDHLELVYTWPNTFCLNKTAACKTPVPQNFILHGLWPADRTGKTLVYCDKPENISWAYTKYEKNLEASWPTLRRDMKNGEFWQQQWDKHGICAVPRMTTYKYLQVIILQKRRFDLLRALKTNNIHPNGSSYPRKTVEAAVAQVTGGRTFYISCQSSMIREIYICLDGDGQYLVSCPISHRVRGCGGGGRKTDLVFPGAAVTRT